MTDRAHPDLARPDLRNLLDSLPCLVASVAADGSILFVNEAAEQWFGSSPEELTGKHVSDLVGSHGYTQAYGYIAAVLAGAPQRFEDTLISPAGEALHTQVDLMPTLRDGDPDGFHLLATDISARVMAEATLEQAMTTAALLEHRSRIAAEMHDRVIQSLYAAGLGAHKARTIPAEAPVFIDAITECIDHAIAELRRAVRKLTSVPEPTSLRTAMGPVIRQAGRWLGQEPTIRTEGHLDELAPEVAQDLLVALSRMLSAVALRADVRECEIEVVATSDEVSLIVADDGEGQADAGRGGTLAELAAQAERWSGLFWIEPRRPRGSVMTWQVPVTDPDDLSR